MGYVPLPCAAGKSAYLLVSRLTDVKGHLLGLRHCSQVEHLGSGCFQELMNQACVYEIIKWPRCLLKEKGMGA